MRSLLNLALVLTLATMGLMSCGDDDALQLPDINPCDSTQYVGITLGADGTTLTANSQGGTAPYTYQWSTGATTPSISTDGTGSYSVTLTDAAGCQSVSDYVFIPGGSPCDSTFAVSITTDPDSLVLTANVNGGAAPYTFVWSEGASSPSITTTGTGSFSVTVFDVNGCQTSDAFEFQTAPAPCDDFAVAIQFYQDSTQAGTTVFQADITNGTAPFVYTWSNGATTSTTTTTAMGGNFSVTVTDDSGCSATDLVQF